jgi:archaellum component FlaC
MAALERVMQLQGEGLSESQIINTLRQEKVSPKEIYDALTQSQIKSELSQTPQVEYETNEMNPSIIQQAKEEYPTQESYSNSSQVEPEQPYPEYTEPPTSSQEYYPQYQEDQPPQQQAADIETINEIAEQIVEEKNVELKKQISEIKNFKEEAKAEIDRLNEKIEKIENNYNELQIAIIRKIGDYGENIKNIASEMHETQNSFSKIINPLTDNIRELQKITGTVVTPISNQIEASSQPIPSEQTQEVERRTKKSEPSFEEYLR